MQVGPLIDEQKREQPATSAFEHEQCVTVVWDDPVNLKSYVTRVFQRHFGYSPQRAESLMLLVHNEGRAVVARGLREHMEADALAMHGYGLQATVEPAASRES